MGAGIELRFEMTDALFARAVREEWLSHGRRLFDRRFLAVVAASLAVAYFGLRGQAHWLGWLALVPPGLLVVLAIAWGVALWWLPRQAPRRLARLADRAVALDLDEARLAFRTANERLEVAWPELAEVKRLPSVWRFCLRTGARIPVPAPLVTGEAERLVRERLAGGAGG